MTAIIDEDIPKEISRLESQGNFSLARLLRGDAEINLDAVAQMTIVPAKYLRYLVNSPLYQQLRMQYDERDVQSREKKEQTREFITHLMELHQREIDRHTVEFTFDGQKIKMSQGDLRKSMENRVKDLKEQIEMLQRSGKDPAELQRLQELVEIYDPTIEKAKQGKANAEMVDTMKLLMQKDPEWAEWTKANKIYQTTATDNRRTSAAKDYLDSNTEEPPQSLKNCWEKMASGSPITDVPATSPPEKKKNLEAVYDAAKF